ncbi:hypothetical protein RF11_00769 [Thelohanellus kitauei]|uniref:Integrase catalytic domain-containing protein n=1 Tax=Thelohanellus kitauei TaxID=669202 RepID=A0A0C2J0L6_THEKT|nr:hypothetical protein RF11_00769 [Thelohanellus kitauei]
MDTDTNAVSLKLPNFLTNQSYVWFTQTEAQIPCLPTDREPQFPPDLWNHLCKILGYHVYPTTAYRPQANGSIERFLLYLKATLYARVIDPNWVDEIPWILLGIRTTPKENLKASSAVLVYRATIRKEISPQTLLDQLLTKVKNLYPVSPCYRSNTPKLTLHLQKDTRRVQKSSTTPYDGPYLVFRIRAQKMRIIETFYTNLYPQDAFARSRTWLFSSEMTHGNFQSLWMRHAMHRHVRLTTEAEQRRTRIRAFYYIYYRLESITSY